MLFSSHVTITISHVIFLSLDKPLNTDKQYDLDSRIVGHAVDKSVCTNADISQRLYFQFCDWLHHRRFLAMIPDISQKDKTIYRLCRNINFAIDLCSVYSHFDYYFAVS